jgi:hypothetical protein
LSSLLVLYFRPKVLETSCKISLQSQNFHQPSLIFANVN